MVSVYVRSSLIQLHTPDEMRGRVSAVSQLTISASNELGEAESAEEQLALTRDEITSPSTCTQNGRTILYIEDNLDNVRLVERILFHRPSIRLLTALQGSVGLDLAQQHRPDLILLDVHLPDLNGEQILRRLKAVPETQPIPVVVISADATTRQIENLRTAGCQNYLTKPFDVPRFLGIVDEVLQGGAVKC